MEANNLYGHSRSQTLPYNEINFDENVILEDMLISPDDIEIGCFVEVDLFYPDNLQEKNKEFSI